MESATIVFDRYRIVRRLGSSGLTLVYEGYDEVEKRPVAIKELLPEHAGDASVRARFQFGARAFIGMELPHMVRTYDVINEGGNAYLILELMPGGSLAERLNRKKQLPVEASLQIIFDVLRALEEAHAHGLVHRNIKPESILFGAGDEAKLSGWGLADVPRAAFERGFSLPSIVKSRSGVEVLVYTAPEQILKQKVDAHCDQYALGSVLYTMLTGASCIDLSGCASLDEAMHAIVTQVPQPPSVRNPDIPAWLDSVVLKTLEKQPECRFTDVVELRDALRKQSVVLSSSSENTVEKPPVRTHQNRFAAAHSGFLRRTRSFAGSFIGGVLGASAGLLLGGVAYGVRIALVGLPRTLQEGAAQAMLSGVVVAALLGALLGWIARSDDAAR